MASEPLQPSVSRRKIVIALTVVTVLIAVIAVAYVMVIARPESGTTLVVTHYNPSYTDPARVAIYLDDELKQEVSIDVGANHTIVFKLTRGNHTIGFDYTISPSSEPDGVIDAEYSVEITNSDPKELHYEVGDGFNEL
jgi:hypothetical protein